MDATMVDLTVSVAVGAVANMNTVVSPVVEVEANDVLGEEVGTAVTDAGAHSVWL